MTDPTNIDPRAARAIERIEEEAGQCRKFSQKHLDERIRGELRAQKYALDWAIEIIREEFARAEEGGGDE